MPLKDQNPDSITPETNTNKEKVQNDTDEKPNHSHGTYYTASTYKPGPTDSLGEAIERFGKENLTIRENITRKAGQAIVIEEKRTNRTVWSSSEKPTKDEVIKALTVLGIDERY